MASTNSHQMLVEIGFKHCDPAGIVFYPRYTEMLNDTVEHWFKHGLCFDFDRLHRVHQLAIPTVSLACDFKAPSRLGETLTCSLTVTKTGRSSVTVSIELTGEDRVLRVKAEATFVFVHIESLKALEIPVDLRRLIEGYGALEVAN